jgi:hypothetical protein
MAKDTQLDFTQHIASPVTLQDDDNYIDYYASDKQKKPSLIKKIVIGLKKTSDLLIGYAKFNPDYQLILAEKWHKNDTLRLSQGEDDIAVYQKTVAVKDVEHALQLALYSRDALENNRQLTGVFSGIATLLPFNALLWVAFIHFNQDWTISEAMKVWLGAGVINTIILLAGLKDKFHFAWCKEMLKMLPVFKSYEHDNRIANQMLENLVKEEQTQHEYLTYIELKLANYKQTLFQWIQQSGKTEEEIREQAYEYQYGSRWPRNSKENKEGHLWVDIDSIEYSMQYLMNLFASQDGVQIVTQIHAIMSKFESMDNFINEIVQQDIAQIQQVKTQKTFKEKYREYKDNHLFKDYMLSEPVINLIVPIKPMVVKKVEPQVETEKLKKLL